jgi:hypothetical protein
MWYTINHHGTVEVFGGKYHKAFKQNGLWYAEELKRGEVEKVFTQILKTGCQRTSIHLQRHVRLDRPDWPKRESNLNAIHRKRVVTTRIVKQETGRNLSFP